MANDAENSKPKRVVGRPFQKNQSGNPGGRPKAVKEALELFRKPEDLEKLRVRLLEIAMNDNLVAANIAIKEYHDRAYGKAPQAITGTDDGPVKVDASGGLLELFKQLASEK